MSEASEMKSVTTYEEWLAKFHSRAQSCDADTDNDVEKLKNQYRAFESLSQHPGWELWKTILQADLTRLEMVLFKSTDSTEIIRNTGKVSAIRDIISGPDNICKQLQFMLQQLTPDQK